MSGDASSPTGPDSLGDLGALARRLAEAIAAAEAVPAESQPRGIVFKVGTTRLVLPLSALREVVIPPSRLSRVPRAPAALLGIMNLRGRVLAVVDLLHALPPSLGARPAGTVGAPGDDLATGRLLIFERDRREVGLLVASVEGIGPLPDSTTNDLKLIDARQIGDAIDALLR
jgi:purine-binding chemotaxis protein CheW